MLSNYFFPAAQRAPFAFRLASCCFFELVLLYSKHPGFCEIKAGLVKVKRQVVIKLLFFFFPFSAHRRARFAD